MPRREGGVTQSLVFSGFVVVALISLGRVAGFGREALVVGILGLTERADVAVLALTVPDMLTGLLLAGGLTAALVPEFRARGSVAGALFWQASLLAVTLGSLLALTLFFLGSGWVSLLAPGLSAEGTRLAAGAFEIVALAVPMAMLAGVTAAFLNASDRFALSASGTLIFNAVVISGLWLSQLVSVSVITSLAAAVVVAAASRLLPQFLLSASLAGARVGPGWLISGALLRRYIYGVVASSALVLLPIVARALASFGESGAIASVNLAIKLVDLPIGVAIAVLPMIFLPQMSEKFIGVDADQEDGVELLSLALRLGLAVMAAVTFPAILFMPALVQLLLGYGEMDVRDVERVSDLARLAFCYFPFQALILIMAAGFNANRDTWIPMLINGAVLVLFLMLGGGAVGQLGESGIMVGLVGAYAVSAVLSLLSFGFRYGTPIWSRMFTRNQLLALAASFVVFAISGGVNMLLPSGLVLARVALAVCLAGVILAIMLAGSPEVRDWLRERLGRVQGE